MINGRAATAAARLERLEARLNPAPTDPVARAEAIAVAARRICTSLAWLEAGNEPSCLAERVRPSIAATSRPQSPSWPKSLAAGDRAIAADFCRAGPANRAPSVAARGWAGAKSLSALAKRWTSGLTGR
jgi:hypothetical protein